MRTNTAVRRLGAGLAGIVLLALPVAGCDSSSDTPTATAKPQANAAAPQPLTGAEQAWLAEIAKLQKKVEKETTSRTTEVLTTSRMRAYERLLRGCRRKLAQLGAPSERLRPVYTVTDKACGRAAAGAGCLAMAIKLGSTFSSEAAARRSDKAIKCGLDGLGDTTNLLADTVIKGEEIKSAAG